MSSDEIATAAGSGTDLQPALPAAADGTATNPSATPTPATSASALLQPPPAQVPPPVPMPRVRTWRPPAVPDTGDDATRMRRALERRERLQRGRLLATLWTTIKVSVVVFITYGLIFNFSIVRGSSMAPGIHDGDRILVDHLSFLFRDVHRGGIVVLQYPLDPSLDYIKRVIGLP